MIRAISGQLVPLDLKDPLAQQDPKVQRVTGGLTGRRDRRDLKDLLVQ